MVIPDRLEKQAFYDKYIFIESRIALFKITDYPKWRGNELKNHFANNSYLESL